MKSRKWDFVPVGFSGKGGKGYILKDWVIHKGKGAAKTNKNFDKVVRCTGDSTKEHHLSKKLLWKMKAGGPRYASMGRAERY